MKRTGIRRFKDHLSSYLRAADEGDLVVITKRGADGYELRARKDLMGTKARRKGIREMIDRLRSDSAAHGRIPISTDRLAELLAAERADRA